MQDHHRDGSNPSHPAGDSGKHPLRVDFDRRVVAKVEWHPGELYPPVGFIVTNLSRPAARVTKFYNGGREKILLTIFFIIILVAFLVALQLFLSFVEGYPGRIFGAADRLAENLPPARSGIDTE